MKTSLGNPAEEYCVELSYNPRWGLQRSVKLRDMKHGTTPAANYRLVALGYFGHGVGWITVCRKEICNELSPARALSAFGAFTVFAIVPLGELLEGSVQGLFESMPCFEQASQMTWTRNYPE